MYKLHIDSSAVDAVRYEPSKWRLAVEFHNEQPYMYYYRGVPPAVVSELERADSVGRFINDRIKPFYSFTKIRKS